MFPVLRASVIVKWKKFGATRRILPRVGRDGRTCREGRPPSSSSASSHREMVKWSNENRTPKDGKHQATTITLIISHQQQHQETSCPWLAEQKSRDRLWRHRQVTDRWRFPSDLTELAISWLIQVCKHVVAFASELIWTSGSLYKNIFSLWPLCFFWVKTALIPKVSILVTQWRCNSFFF